MKSVSTNDIKRKRAPSQSTKVLTKDLYDINNLKTKYMLNLQDKQIEELLSNREMEEVLRSDYRVVWRP